MANNVTMSFANIIKIKGYYLFYGNILKMKKLCFGKEIDFPTTTAIPTIQKKLGENGSAPATIETNEERSFFLIDIPCHPDFAGDDLNKYKYYVYTSIHYIINSHQADCRDFCTDGTLCHPTGAR